MATQQKNNVAESLRRRLDILIGLVAATLVVSLVCASLCVVSEIRTRRMLNAFGGAAAEMQSNMRQAQQDLQTDLQSLQFGESPPE